MTNRFLFLKDESKLEPIALPTVIVGTKYDIFETYEPEKKKIIARTLRFMAHYHGAALIVISSAAFLQMQNH